MATNRRITTLHNVAIPVIAATMALLWVGMASAQEKRDDELVPDKIESKADEKKKDGWYPKLSIGASLSFSHSSKVVGAQNGQTWSLGPSLDFSLDYFGGPHEWRNTLTIKEVFTRTPLIDEFVKTMDELKLQSIYLFHIKNVHWLGPFARLSLTTAIFPGADVQPDTKTYLIKELDGSTTLRTNDRIALTDAFAPLTLKESIGLFAQPVDKEVVKIEFRLGVGARESFVQDGLAIADDDGTPEIDVNRLEDFQQVGGELFGGISGTVTWENLGKDRPLLYGVSIEVLLPFYSSADQGMSLTDLTVIDIQATLGIKLFSWMSLDYSLRALKDPLIIDEWQIQNNLLLNFSYALID